MTHRAIRPRCQEGSRVCALCQPCQTTRRRFVRQRRLKFRYTGFKNLERPSTRPYSADVIRRILMTLLLAWIGVAPAIAQSCAAECGMGDAIRQQAVAADQGHTHDGVPSCHGDQEPAPDSKVPDGASMAVACLVAATAAIPTIVVPMVASPRHTEQNSFVLLPPFSFETSAPNKPPQA